MSHCRCFGAPEERRISSTYSTVFPADEGEYPEEEHGFLDEEGSSMEPDEYDTEEGITAVDKAVKFLKYEGATEQGSDVDYYTPDSDINYRTGTYTTRSYRLHGFTPEELREVSERMHRRGLGWAKGSFEVGQRVIRKGIKIRGKVPHGVIVALEDGKDNHGRPKPAARVRWDHEDPKRHVYPYLFEELEPEPAPNLGFGAPEGAEAVLGRSKKFQSYLRRGVGPDQLMTLTWMDIFEELWPAGFSDQNFIYEGPELYLWLKAQGLTDAIAAYNEYLGVDPE